MAEGDLDASYGRKSHGGVVDEAEFQACVVTAPRPMRALSLGRYLG